MADECKCTHESLTDAPPICSIRCALGRRPGDDGGGERAAAAQVRQVHRHGGGERRLRRDVPQGDRGAGGAQPRAPVGAGQLDLLGG